MIKNKYSIYVIENCLELLIQINENYYINSIRNNLGYFNNENNGEKDDEYSFENFLQLKKQIFQFIENNSAAKEKKKILALIKSNRYKRVWNIFININIFIEFSSLLKRSYAKSDQIIICKYKFVVKKVWFVNTVLNLDFNIWLLIFIYKFKCIEISLFSANIE